MRAPKHSSQQGRGSTQAGARRVQPGGGVAQQRKAERKRAMQQAAAARGAGVTAAQTRARHAPRARAAAAAAAAAPPPLRAAAAATPRAAPPPPLRAAAASRRAGARRAAAARPPHASASGGAGSAAASRAAADAYFAADSRPIILFDGVCNMCNGGVNFALDFDPEGRFRFAALQSAVGRALLVRHGRAADDISSIVLVERDRCYTKSEAVLRIAQRLQDRVGALPLLGFAGLWAPGFVRDTVYDFIAANRYTVFGRADACRLSDGRFEERFVADER
jgi:predicted DCC family thiol-disulfide oxidoreductase YuxK